MDREYFSPELNVHLSSGRVIPYKWHTWAHDDGFVFEYYTSEVLNEEEQKDFIRKITDFSV